MVSFEAVVSLPLTTSGLAKWARSVLFVIDAGGDLVGHPKTRYWSKIAIADAADEDRLSTHVLVDQS